jgi:C2H2-type zinc finger
MVKSMKTFTSGDNNENSKSSVLECRFCGKVFKSRQKLRAHSMRHETETTFFIKCIHKGCKQTFFSADVLKKHVAEHLSNSSVVEAVAASN